MPKHCSVGARKQTNGLRFPIESYNVLTDVFKKSHLTNGELQLIWAVVGQPIECQCLACYRAMIADWWSNTDVRVSELNGSQGEATGTDDLSKRILEAMARKRDRRLKHLRMMNSFVNGEVERLTAECEYLLQNLHQPASQLNGCNGEVTNSDDRNGTNAVARKNARAIKALRKSIAKMSGRARPKGQAKPKKKRAGASRAKRTFKPRGKTGSGAVADPVTANVLGQLNPSVVPRSTLSCLTNSRPSQKVTLTANLLNLSIANNQACVLAIAPNGSNDTTSCSVFGYVATTGNIAGSNNLVLGETNPAQGAGSFPTDSVTPVILATQGPYSKSQLASDATNIRFVCGKMTVSPTTQKLYRGGQWLVYHDDQQQLSVRYHNSVNDSTGLSCNAIQRVMEGSSRSLKYPADQDFNIVINGSDHIIPTSSDGSSATGGTWTNGIASVSGYASADASWNGSVFGNIGISPNTTAGHPIGFMYLSNTTGQTQTFSLRWEEHWEYNGQQIEALHTPSASHSAAASALTGLLNLAKSSHAQNPKEPLSSVVKKHANTTHSKSTLKGMEHIFGPAIESAVASHETEIAQAGIGMMLL